MFIGKKQNEHCTLHQSVSSVAQSCPTLCDPMNCSMPGFPVLYYFLEYARIHVHWVSDAVQPSHPLLPPSPPVLNLSQHQSLFQWIGSLNQVAKVLELSALASVLPVNMQGWFPLGLTDLISLKSEGLSSLLQHHSSKASVLQCSASIMVQPSHPYMTTGKTIALTRWNFAGKVMFLLFNMLSRLFIRRRQLQPTPVLLPGKFHGRRSLVACSPWGR